MTFYMVGSVGQFIDKFKFETRPSSLCNSEMVTLMGLFLNTVHRRFQKPTFEKSLYHFGRLFLTFKSPSVDFSQVPKSCAVFVVFTLKRKISIILKMIQY